MIDHNFLTYSGKIILQILGEILYFPLWWYSVGFFRLLVSLWKFWRNLEKILGFSVWVKNIFVPMYGQRDFASRLISFVMRSVQIVVRGLGLLFFLLPLLAILILWLVFPIFLVYALFFQFFR
ncbi:MAG: hypothetical protein WC249_01000 [Patescibacteria group bacterium]|jgi:hypothetical protein